MSFSRDGLGRNASGQAHAKTSWSYTSNDPYAEVGANGYFDEAQKEMKRGDSVLVWDDLTGVMTQTYVADSSPGGGVNLATGVVIPA